MRLFSYVVARDFGFAPNPFYGFCSLACCKPAIRRTARVGDWIAGTSPMKKGKGDLLVYAMHVSEILTFDDYWKDPRFSQKRPRFDRSLKHAYGDNIYHRNPETAQWIQENSHHSLDGGEINSENLKRDTGTTDKVLIAITFAYWGGRGPTIPLELQDFDGQSFCIRSSAHKSLFSAEFVLAFVQWFHDLKETGVCESPDEWSHIV